MNIWQSTERERELEREIARLQAAQYEREGREESQREQERREREEERREAMHQAADWPEAFRKQYQLIGPELHFSERELAATEKDTRYTDPAERERDLAFWREDVEHLKNDLANIAVAERIYAEEAAKAQVEIEATIKAMRERMLATVIDRLKPLATGTSRGFTTDLIERLAKDDPTAWLNW